MWTRQLLKSNAKEGLKRYYWPAFLVCLVTAILCGTGTGGTGVTIDFELDADTLRSFLQSMDPQILWALIMASLSVGVMSLLFQIFVGNLLVVGSAEFFLVSRSTGQAAPMESMLKGFQIGYGKVVLTLFLRQLYVFLWSLLFVVPGIVKSYEYRLVPYILADYPEFSQQEVFAESKRLMAGHKMEAFVLDWSFFGWQMLGALLCGVGSYFVLPYMEATYAEFYTALKETTPV